jgi:hypothetical protein
VTGSRALRPFARFAVVAVVAALAGAAAAPVRADTADFAKFVGTYQYAGRDEDGIAIIDKAIAEAVAQLPKVKGLVVKKVLEANRRFIKLVTIDLPSGRVHIKLDDLDIDVKPGEAKDIGGGAKLTVRMKGQKLEQVIQSDRGSLVTLYEVADGGQVLHRDVSVTDKWLQNPVRYRLTYKRR